MQLCAVGRVRWKLLVPLAGFVVRNVLTIFVAVVFAAGAVGCGEPIDGNDGERAGWEAELYSPTQLTRLGDRYFLVDCWHNRILYNDELGDDLLDWEVLDGELAGPHSIATDGEFYVVDDTGLHTVNVYVDTEDGFLLHQTLGGEELWNRPHRVQYDDELDAFFVIGSHTHNVTKLVADGDELVIERDVHLEFLDGDYTRSMSIIDGKMYFVSGPDRIHKTRHRDGSFDVIDSWDVPPEFSSMIDIYHIDDHYFLTATVNWWDQEFFEDNTIVRCADLDDFVNGGCEDLRDELGIKGAPYYLSEIDDRVYVPQVYQYSGVVSFVAGDGGEVTEVETVFDSGPPGEENKEERFRLPK